VTDIKFILFSHFPFCATLLGNKKASKDAPTHKEEKQKPGSHEIGFQQ
jgi:hypothetical protein